MRGYCRKRSSGWTLRGSFAIHLNVIGSGSLLGVCFRRAVASSPDRASDAGFCKFETPSLESGGSEPMLRAGKPSSFR
jgi:hypothetical protein